MPRLPRLDIPGLLYHVVCRGIERKEIFKDEKDYKHLFERLSSLAGGENVKVYAFALMPNHIHLLIRPLNIALSTFMRKLLTGYAIYFNRRHSRAGHLFQNRYKSYLVEEDTYYLELIRYIHLNPVRAGIIDFPRLSFWPYSGHGALMGKAKHPFLEAEDVLLIFSDKAKEARQKLTQFMKEGLSHGRRDDLAGGGLKRSLVRSASASRKERQAYDERILGSGLFVESILKEIEKSAGTKRRDVSLEKLLSKVASFYDLTIPELCSGSRRLPIIRARAAAIFVGSKELGLAPKELFEALNVGVTAVYELLRSSRGEMESRGIALE